MNIILVGHGYIGEPLARSLYQKGHEILVVKRQQVAAPYPILCRDLTQPSKEKILHPSKPYKVVFTLSPDHREENSYEKIYIQAQKNLLDALDLTFCEGLIITTSTGVYEQSQGEVVSEDDAHPQKTRGKILLQAEKIAWDYKIPTVTLRLGGIFGPGRNQMLKSYANSPDQERFVNLVHQEDCVRAIEFVLERQLPHSVFNVVGVSGVRVREIVSKEGLSVLSFKSGEEGAFPPKTRRIDSSNKQCTSERIQKLGFCYNHTTFQSNP